MTAEEDRRSEGESWTVTGSIRHRMVVLVLAVTLPLVALGAYFVWSQARASRTLAIQTVQELSQGAAFVVEVFLKEVERELAGLSSRPAVQAMAGGECGPYLTEASQVLRFDNVVILDREGAVRCRARPAAPEPTRDQWGGLNPAHEGLALGLPVPTERGSGWTTPVSHTMADSAGRVVGFAGFLIDIDAIRDRIASYPSPPEGTITLAHIDGTAIVRSDSEKWTGMTLPRVEGGSQHRYEGQGISHSVGIDGVHRVWGYQTVADSTWIVYAGIPETWAADQVRAETLGTGLAIAVLAALLAALVTGLYRKVNGSLASLVRGVERAAAGGSATDIPVQGPEEVVAVARAFSRTLAARDDAEAAKLASMRRYQSILHNSVFGIYIATADGRFLEANPTLARMLGYDSVSDVLTTPLDQLFADRDEGRRLTEAALERESGSTVAEVEWLRRDDSVLHARLYITTIADDDEGTILEVIAEDLTERNQLEEELRQAQKLEAVGRLAGGVAHDFNNRLTVIQGQAGVLASELAPDDPRMESVRAILESSDRAARLTAQLLAFGRRQFAQPKTLDLNRVLRHTSRVLRQVVGEGIEVELDLAEDLGSIRADAAQIEQVLLNLASNARDAMPEGGTIRLRTYNVSAESASGFAAAPAVVLEVEDTGLGMDDETRSHAFEPFFTTKPPDKGTGLGLSIVYGVVKQSGGHVEVRSRQGRGTTFEIRFPEIDGVPVERVPRTVPVGRRPSTPPRKTVLVVEDEDPVRSIVGLSLARAGYRVLEAPDGERGIALFEEHASEIDVLVTDVVMPRIRGDVLAQRLQSVKPNLHVVLISGYAGDADPLLVRSHEGWRFLAKPFAATDLLATLYSFFSGDPQGPNGSKGAPTGVDA